MLIRSKRSALSGGFTGGQTAPTSMSSLMDRFLLTSVKRVAFNGETPAEPKLFPIMDLKFESGAPVGAKLVTARVVRRSGVIPSVGSPRFGGATSCKVPQC